MVNKKHRWGIGNDAWKQRKKGLRKIGICVRCKNKDYLCNIHKMCKYCKATKTQKERLYNLSIDEYDEITKKCLLCRFNKTVDIHHMNGVGNNRSTGNNRKDDKKHTIGLCPNHHRLLHSRIYGDDVHQQILKKLDV